MGGVVLANTTHAVPRMLADAMARYPEEADGIESDLNVRRVIAGLPRYFGVGM